MSNHSYIHADLHEVAAALAALTEEPPTFLMNLLEQPCGRHWVCGDEMPRLAAPAVKQAFLEFLTHEHELEHVTLSSEDLNARLADALTQRGVEETTVSRVAYGVPGVSHRR
jgi:hypothetical protein